MNEKNIKCVVVGDGAIGKVYPSLKLILSNLNV